MAQNHTVRQGECLARIAKQYGFLNWRTIYFDPGNKELRQKRPNPNILFPGDIVKIPTLKHKTESIATGLSHVFEIAPTCKELRIVFKNARDEVIDNEPYLIRFDSGRTVQGTTDGDGLLKEPAELHEESAVLAIADRTLNLRLGFLNPSGDVQNDDLTGIQARLNNLGYPSGPNDGIYGRKTRAALALLQSDQDFDINGLPDEDTVAKLEDLHGC